jgi:hypothetical protein
MLTASMLASMILGTTGARAQVDSPRPDLTGIVKDEGWARILGKALFWDTVANAGNMSCAGCHFSAGPDNRIGPAEPVENTRDVIDDCSRELPVRSVEIADASFAPKASAPAPGSADPSCVGRAGARLARKLLLHRPLESRTLHQDDSLLGGTGPHGNLISSTGRGLDLSYRWLIEQAFDAKLWSGPGPSIEASDGRLSPLPGGYTQFEQNFALFWGISVMLYESTLDLSVEAVRPTCQDALTLPLHRAQEPAGST